MSETPKMNPSTFVQVRENMEKLIQLVQQVNELAETTSDISVIKDQIIVIKDQIIDINEKLNDLSLDQSELDAIRADLDKLGDLTNVNITIEEIQNVINDINDKILNPDPTKPGDIVDTDDGVKVVGIHTNTTDKDNDTTPDAYKQGLTLELKKASAVGLSGKTGIDKEYVFVMTFVQDTSIKTESAVAAGTYTCQQVAYADIAGTQYSRISSDGTSWGEWAEMSGTGGDTPIIPDQHLQWVESETEPTDQVSGDYWCEPLA